MGCDIHLCTERLDHKGKWSCTDNFVVNDWYDPEDEDEGSPLSINSFYNGRDYELFGALAGVRRPTADWGCDAHSASFLTLRELQDLQFSLGDTVTRSGMVSPGDALAIDNGTGVPEGWCQGTTVTSWVYREWQDSHNPLNHFMETLYKFLDIRFYNYEVSEIKKNPEKFRIVFWFDN